MDFNDLKVILGVFHNAESIYDTFKAITGSFNSLPVEKIVIFGAAERQTRDYYRFKKTPIM